MKIDAEVNGIIYTGWWIFKNITDNWAIQRSVEIEDEWNEDILEPIAEAIIGQAIEEIDLDETVEFCSLEYEGDD